MKLEKFGHENIDKLLEKYSHVQSDSVFTLSEVIAKYREHAEFCQKNKVNLGFQGIDYNLHGIQPGEVCYIVSATGVGKTAVSLQICKNNLFGDAIIPSFSLENNEYQTFERIVQLETGVPFWETQKRFINGDVDFQAKINEIADRWDEHIVHIVKRVKLTDIVPYTRTCEELTGKRAKVLMIDYAQLIKVDQPNEYLKISQVAQELKAISLELRLPMIVFSQVSRMSAKDELTLYSAKGSGEIENSAQIYFTIEKEERAEVKAELKITDLEGYTLLKITPHKVKRMKFNPSYLLMNEKTLEIKEISKPPIIKQDDLF